MIFIKIKISLEMYVLKINGFSYLARTSTNLGRLSHINIPQMLFVNTALQNVSERKGVLFERAAFSKRTTRIQPLAS